MGRGVAWRTAWTVLMEQRRTRRATAEVPRQASRCATTGLGYRSGRSRTGVIREGSRRAVVNEYYNGTAENVYKVENREISSARIMLRVP